MAKARIFIDFWNFQLGVSANANKPYQVDWIKLSPWIMQEAKILIGDPSLSYEGTRVYMSYNPRRKKDASLRDWAHNFLDRVPGVNVICKERQFKKPPTCPDCYTPIDPCPHCGGPMIGTIEKGVDTALVSDLLGLAWGNAWDVAVLLTSDKDFIPAVELLSTKGYRVINAHFPPQGMQLAKTCWASIDLKTALPHINR